MSSLFSVNELTNISSDYTVGFGIFSDKRTLPMSLRSYVIASDFGYVYIYMYMYMYVYLC